jgi:fructan beta-fructosidase
VTPEDPTSPAEPGRPLVHFTPARNWMNDPNGLVHHDGEYHLFFQHNPHGCDRANMSWGHAVSGDLVHWRALPVAIAGNDIEQVYSGSAVVDAANRTGLGATGPAMVAIYTSVAAVDGNQAQSLASSTDRGRTWSKHVGNPVLDIGSTDFRDPKVLWHEPTSRWIMVVARSSERAVQFYASDDLIRWELLSEHHGGRRGPDEGIWECPDLFELGVDDDPGNTRWVLVVSVNDSDGPRVEYAVGAFDGQAFGGGRWQRLDHGRDFYAAVSWEGAPDGHRAMIGWLGSWSPGHHDPALAWRGQQSVPREVTLRAFDGGLRLVQRPVDALTTLRRTTPATLRPREVADHAPTSVAQGAALDITAMFSRGTATRFGLRVLGSVTGPVEVGYDTRTAMLYVDRGDPGSAARAPVPTPSGRLTVRMLLDVSSVEVFAGSGGNGEVAVTHQLPCDAQRTVEVWADGGTATLERLEAWRLGSYRDA